MRWSIVVPLCAILWVSYPAKSIAAPERQDSGSEELPRAMKAKALAASFEVVIPRPDEKVLTYEKALPWDLVPFQIRNDKYYSIGTAFAVSATELVTAFHVLGLDVESRTFPDFFIRDATGKVFELDQITGSDQRRDVAHFTVKGRRFETWLELNPKFEMNRAVFSVGNALGEGNVLRRGDLIGTIPEAVDGEWNLLKSSADVNGGNSGGPLLDLQGRVIGVVLQRQDNISLSLPVAELLRVSKKSATFFGKYYIDFPMIPEQSANKTYQFDVPLPAPFRGVKASATEKLKALNERETQAFLDEQAPSLFPSGDSSHEAILGIPSSSDTEVYQKSEETRIWSLSDVAVNATDLGNNGELRVSGLAKAIAIGRIRLPDGTSVAGFFRDPRVFMDYLYKGLNIPLQVGGQKIRITSLGEPFRKSTLTDRWGRPWFLAIWLNPMSDQVTLAYTTPIPGGAAFLLRELRSAALRDVEFDTRPVLNFVDVPYSGRLKDWQELMKLPELLPEAFRTMILQIDVGRSLDFRSPTLSLSLEQKEWPIEANGWLGLGMGFRIVDGRPAWTLRRVFLQQDEKDDYFTIRDHLRPFPGMDDVWANSWNTVVRGLHPYDRQLFSEDGSSAIAMVIPSPAVTGDDADSRMTLYLSRPGAMTRSQARKDLSVLADSITIAGAARASAGGQKVAQ
jgi:S1-C subfamily serine protease